MNGHRSIVAALAAMLLVSCDQVMSLAQGDPAIRDDGAYVLLEVDTAVLQRQRLDETADRMAEALRAATPTIRYTGRGVAGDAARIRLIDTADGPRALAVLAELSPDVIITGGEGGVIEARMTPAAIGRLSEMAVSRSIVVLQRRLDRMASVAPYRGGRIMVRTNASAVDPTLRPRLTEPALLTFHSVREVAPEELAVGLLPPGSMLVGPYPEMGQGPEVVDRRPRLTGGHLQRASAAVDRQTGEHTLVFTLDEQGTRIFCRITRESTGRRFAVLLDNQVLTAPVIHEPICGGSGIISGFSRGEAEELAIMLNAGALPAPLMIIAQGVGAPPSP